MRNPAKFIVIRNGSPDGYHLAPTLAEPDRSNTS